MSLEEFYCEYCGRVDFLDVDDYQEHQGPCYADWAWESDQEKDYGEEYQ